ncbi:MAG: flagellar basal body-associated FliL family protein [Gammaproteobacteria bacterium]|nr:flagellar basal body-associated FliL family protein [Gammaproteobacteria bacterium]MCW8986202.1 flagellar basal body-associated FliL family protein [Gammaproteobacteria bacterium]MCW9031958.1 flagellar basal body-associated FliL family protein [Gammaproteobacteria bacterium]
MKFLSLVFFLLLSNAALASGGGGGGSSPFIPLNPPIIVNIIDGEKIRHMQVIIEIKLVDPANSAKVDLHKGPIRHELILLLSSQDAGTISSALGKEQLRKDALAAVQKVMQELEGAPIIEALYFTNFIIQ